MNQVDIVVGARPNFMKVAPIIAALTARGADAPCSYRLIHTGQHYDQSMSESFFDQLGIPPPAINLGVGSGTQAEQTAAIMVGYEKALVTRRPQLCLVVGDVTSTLACAIVAQKSGTPVAHVEGGIRSGDWDMPEEINRIVTDSISSYFFTTSDVANQRLRLDGVPNDRIHFVGNTMIDTLLTHRARFRPPIFWSSDGLAASRYAVLTLHRPANVDAPERLGRFLDAICAEALGMPVVFPAHPRTAKSLAQLGSRPRNLLIVEPQPYLEFNYLVERAKVVVTDSGGITEEATVLGVPCMTLRDSTERPETVTIGTNELLGTEPDAIAPAFQRLREGRWKRGAIPEKWDGRAGDRIVAALATIFQTGGPRPRAHGGFTKDGMR